MEALFTGIAPILCVIVVVVLGLISASVRIVQEYERGVIFRLGRVQAAKG
ncbi:MAG: slipin family protein, partial [Chloroflexota bacterium]